MYIISYKKQLRVPVQLSCPMITNPILAISPKIPKQTKKFLHHIISTIYTSVLASFDDQL